MNSLETFKQDVHAGLSGTPKSLPSKYFYDEKGDDLFIQIMQMPEYYLTDAELEIFTEQSAQLAQSLGMDGRDFDLVELGAGDGTKTQHLLEELLKKHSFTYVPIDISPNAIENLCSRLGQELPSLRVSGKQGEYFQVLESLGRNTRPKVILFLGSNIGNLTLERAAEFMASLARQLNPDDKILLGVDLKKAREVVLPAYNDAAGITREFNLNLLSRINRELEADFNLTQFVHQPEYDTETGTARSYLVSTQNQEVTVRGTGSTYRFLEGERIHTEISQKYDQSLVNRIIADTGLETNTVFQDKAALFADYLLRKT